MNGSRARRACFLRPAGILCAPLAALMIFATPAFAQCVTIPPEDFAALDFGTAERFDQGEALLLIQGMMDAPDLMSIPKSARGTITLWALTVGNQVLILRQTGPTTLCSDEPVDRGVFETGKLRTLPRSG